MMESVDPSLLMASSPVGKAVANASKRVHDDDMTNIAASSRLSSSAASRGRAASSQKSGDLEHYPHCRTPLLLSKEHVTDEFRCDDRSELTYPPLLSRPHQNSHDRFSTTFTNQYTNERDGSKHILDPSFVSSRSANGSFSASGSTNIDSPSIGRGAFKLLSALPSTPRLLAADPIPTTAPSTSSLPNAASSSLDADEEMFDFNELQANYLNMLSNEQADEEMSPAKTLPHLPELPFAYRNRFNAETMRDSPISAQTSPLFSSPHEDFLTHAGTDDPLQEFLTSPDFDTPFSEFLPTPDMGTHISLPHSTTDQDRDQHNDSRGTGSEAVYDHASGTRVGLGFRDDASIESPLIPLDESFDGDREITMAELGPNNPHGSTDADYKKSHQLALPPLPPPPPPPALVSPSSTTSPPTIALTSLNPLDMLKSTELYSMSPALEDMHEFPTSSGPTSYSTAAVRQTRSATTSKYNGTRRNVTPSTLIPDDAPIQRRSYGQSHSSHSSSSSSSSNSNKRTSRKRSASEAFDASSITNEAALESARKQGKISQADYKRIQNTLAARKSRKRKLQYQMDLEDRVTSLERSRDMWRERTRMLVSMMEARGEEVGEFDYEA
jgi:hypothetical protein